MKKRSTAAGPRFFVMFVMLLLSLFALPQTAMAKSGKCMALPFAAICNNAISLSNVHAQCDNASQPCRFVSTLSAQKERAIKMASSIRMLKGMFDQSVQDKQKCLPVKRSEHACPIVVNQIRINTCYQHHKRVLTTRRKYQLRI